jgi:hypothetical protein
LYLHEEDGGATAAGDWVVKKVVNELLCELRLNLSLTHLCNRE